MTKKTNGAHRQSARARTIANAAQSGLRVVQKRASPIAANAIMAPLLKSRMVSRDTTPWFLLNLHLNHGSKDGPCHVWMGVEQLQVPLACIMELLSIVPIDPFERGKHGLQKSKVLHALDVPRGLEKKGSQ